MLLTLFTIGGAAYAVEASELVEVLPLVHIEPIPHAPPMIAGTANYHGTPLVVVDLQRLAGHAPAPRRLSTRILLVQHGSSRLGLLAAGVTGTVKLDASSFVTTGEARDASADALSRDALSGDALSGDALTRDAPWLGARAVHGSGFVRRIEIGSLLEAVGAAA